MALPLSTKKAFLNPNQGCGRRIAWKIVYRLSSRIGCREVQLNRLEAAVQAVRENTPMPAGRMNSRQQKDTDCTDQRT